MFYVDSAGSTEKASILILANFSESPFVNRR